GYYADATGQHGFVYHNGTYTTVDDPLAFNPQTGAAYGMNGSGSAVGYYQTASGQQHGFLYANGAYTTLDAPGNGATSTTATAIDASGDITGYYQDTVGLHGFIYANGGYTTFNAAPNAFGTFATAIRTSSLAAGYFNDGSTHGFRYSGG